jgi:hypothetical protein
MRRERSQGVHALLVAALAFTTFCAHAAAPHEADGRYRPKTERGALAALIVGKWSPHVHRNHGVPHETWAAGMAGTFARAPIADLKAAARQPTFEAMMASLAGRTGADLATERPAPSMMSAALKASGPTESLLYTMIVPCRLVDTRVMAQKLTADSVRVFRSKSSLHAQGGNSACGAQLFANAATAMVLNVTVVYPDSAGYLTLFPYQGTRPLASSLNYRAGDIVGNEIIAQVDGYYDGFFSLYSYAGADVVIDVAGYFSPQVSAPLDCVSEDSAVINVASGATATAVTPACPAEYTPTGGGCQSLNAYPSINGLYFHSFGPTAARTFECAARNRESTTQAIHARVICCRMPVGTP